MIEHTSTLWRIGCGDASNLVCRDSSPGEHAETLARCRTPIIAALIVRACNAHADLLAACEDLLCRLADKHCVSVEELADTPWGAKAAAAIAKARHQSPLSLSDQRATANDAATPASSPKTNPNPK